MEEKLRLFIADHPFFKGISQSDRLISDVVRNSKIKKMEQYRILINQNEPQFYIYFIMSGQVSIFVKKHKMEIDYEKQLRGHFEDIKKKYDYSLKFESENKVLLKKAEMNLKNAFKLVDRNEKQYDDPIYTQSFPNFEQDFLTNKLNIFPLKRVLTLNAGQIVGESSSENHNAQVRNSNITAVSQTKVVFAQIPIEYINTLALPNKYHIIQSAFEMNFGDIFKNDIPLIYQFFDKQILKKGQIIFRTKENTEKIYIVGGGEVELSIEKGNQIYRLILLLQNDMFGYENYSFDRSYQAISCSDDTFIYSIEKQLFFELIENKISFSQIIAQGNEKINRFFYVLLSNLYSKDEKVDFRQENAKDKKLSLTQAEDPFRLKSLKYQNIQMTKFEFQDAVDINKSIIIQGQVNTQAAYDNKGSSSIYLMSDKQEHSRSPNRGTNQKSPKRLKYDQSHSQLDINQLNDQNQSIEQITKFETLPSRIVSSGEKYKKYKFGFGSSKKKEHLTLPTISSNQNTADDKKKRENIPNIIAIEENVQFSNEKIKEAQLALEEMLLINQKGTLSVTSFESKDTQLVMQKALENHKIITNELAKPSANEPKNNSGFLQDLSQQENFKEIQEKIKQQILRNKKSPSPQRAKNNDTINFIIQSRLRKIKSRHHSIENVNSNFMIQGNNRNKPSTIPLDVQFKLQRAKFQEKQHKEDTSSRRVQTEISLNITDQMRAITPLMSNRSYKQHLLDLEFNFQNETLKNLQQKQHQDQQNSQIKQENLTPLENEQNHIKYHDSEFNQYNEVKLGKKRKQLKYLTTKKQDSDLFRLSSELRNIDKYGVSLLSKSQVNELKQTGGIDQKIPKENEKEMHSTTKNQTSMNITHQKQIQNQQLFVVNGEQKQIRDKMNTLPITTTNHKKHLQTLDFNRSDNQKGQTIKTLETKKLSETLTPHPQSTYCNTIDQLILFEQRSTSQILNHQITMPLMDKVNFPLNSLASNQKNRSTTIEEPVKSHNRLNVTEILENKSFINKRMKTSVSPSHKFTQENLKTEWSQLDQSSIAYEDHPVIHQNKKKLSNLPEILKHKAYIQKKIKRQYIRSNEIQHKFQVAEFNKHLQIYQEQYNTESQDIRQKSANYRKTEKSRENHMKAYSNTQNKIFSLSQPPNDNNNEQSQQNNKQTNQIKINYGQIEINMVNNISQKNQEKLNSTQQFKQYSEKKQSFSKLRKKSKNNLITMNTSSEQEFNEQQLYNTLYVKKIMGNSPKNKNSFEQQQINKKIKQEDRILFQTPQKSRSQSQREIEIKVLNNDFSTSKVQEEDNKQNSISPNQMNMSKSQCSFAYGSPIKQSTSQLNQDQSKAIILNKINNPPTSSFYMQSKSSLGENSSYANQDKINSLNHVKSQDINQFIESNQQRQSQIKLSNTQKTKQESEQETKDLSHLNTLKQLEIQRLTETHFSFKD